MPISKRCQHSRWSDWRCTWCAYGSHYQATSFGTGRWQSKQPYGNTQGEISFFQLKSERNDPSVLLFRIQTAETVYHRLTFSGSRAVKVGTTTTLLEVATDMQPTSSWACPRSRQNSWLLQWRICVSTLVAPSPISNEDQPIVLS